MSNCVVWALGMFFLLNIYIYIIFTTASQHQRLPHTPNHYFTTPSCQFTAQTTTSQHKPLPHTTITHHFQTTTTTCFSPSPPGTSIHTYVFEYVYYVFYVCLLCFVCLYIMFLIIYYIFEHKSMHNLLYICKMDR